MNEDIGFLSDIDGLEKNYFGKLKIINYKKEKKKMKMKFMI